MFDREPDSLNLPCSARGTGKSALVCQEHPGSVHLILHQAFCDEVIDVPSALCTATHPTCPRTWYLGGRQ